MKLLRFILLLSCLGFTTFSYGTNLETLQNSWAKTNYQLADEAQTEAFLALIAEADKALEQNPKQADLMIWNAIIRASYADTLGENLEALGHAKQARKLLEQAIEIDPSGLAGTAYTSLAALYAKAPGWPIAFGSEKKARKYFKKALELDPNGMDSNYYWADFLISEKDYADAKAALLKAQQAPSRPGQQIADAGRQKEIQALLDQLTSNWGK